MSGYLPPVPIEFQQYNSYVIDPKYQLRFTYAWLGLFAFALVYFRAPLGFYAALRSGRFWTGWTAYERLGEGAYAHLVEEDDGKLGVVANPNPPPNAPVSGWRRACLLLGAVVQSVAGLPIPVPRLPAVLGDAVDKFVGARQRHRTYLPLTVGQLVLGGAYTAAVAVCVFQDAELSSNSNRLGFLALAQLTPLLLLATKNNPLAFLLTLSYERLNWAHRWAGRLVWLCATVHGALWINQLGGAHTLSDDKMKRGLVAYAALCLIAITSIRPVRDKLYNLFWITHLLCFVGFFAAIAYHTTYARPWIYPPAALYAFDLAARCLKVRMVDALLVPLEGGMTLIHLPDLNRGWLPTQHVYLRILSRSWSSFESHPFTILSSPPSQDSPSQGVTLLAFSAGNWTRAVHALARSSPAPAKPTEAAAGERGLVLVRALMDGPYGGVPRGLAGVELGVCVAGGSGVSFLLGVGEEGRAAMQEARGGQAGGRLSGVRLVWVLREFETYLALQPLFRPLLSPRQTLTLYLSHPPPPAAHAQLGAHTTLAATAWDASYLRALLALPADTPSQVGGGAHAYPGPAPAAREKPTGGVRVLACGPPGLVKDVQGAVGALAVGDRAAMGGVEFLGEGFAL